MVVQSSVEGDVHKYIPPSYHTAVCGLGAPANVFKTADGYHTAAVS